MSNSLLTKNQSLGFSYKEYLDLTKQEVETADPSQLAGEERKRFEDKKLNESLYS